MDVIEACSEVLDCSEIHLSFSKITVVCATFCIQHSYCPFGRIILRGDNVSFVQCIVFTKSQSAGLCELEDGCICCTDLMLNDSH